MNLATLGTRGTDVVIAGLKLPRRFSRADLVESYGSLRRERDGTLPQWWHQGISNEIQRLGSDFSRFHKEGRKLDLIARVGAGECCFRDEVRPKLIDAANQRADLLMTQNTLVVPIAIDTVGEVASHVIGAYAHQKIMQALCSNGYEVLKDTSSGRSYDCTFCGRNRYDTPQSKGTRKAEGEIDIALTPNELTVMTLNPLSYWLGVVYRIQIVDNKACGGTDPFLTRPPILDHWQFTPAYRLRRKSDVANSGTQGFLFG